MGLAQLQAVTHSGHWEGQLSVWVEILAYGTPRSRALEQLKPIMVISPCGREVPSLGCTVGEGLPGPLACVSGVGEAVSAALSAWIDIRRRKER